MDGGATFIIQHPTPLQSFPSGIRFVAQNNYIMLEQPYMNPLPPTGDDGNSSSQGCVSCVGIILTVVICALLTLLFGCRSTRTIVELRDSIRTEVVTNTIYIPDTQYVTLPPQTVERTTPDTTSTLRIDYAISTATIQNGLLHHTLSATNTPIPVPVQHQVTTRDSIVYREKEVPVPVPVVQEVERPLTSWQQFRLWLGNIILITLALAATIFIFRKRTWWIAILKRFIK